MDDRTAIDALIARFLGAFDNRAGRVPQLDEVTAPFANPATVVAHGPSGIVVTDPAAFATPRIALLQGGTLVDFHEWEIEAETDVRGSLAIRRSRYAKQGRLNGQPYGGTGTKHFQLARLAEGWRIVALSWIDDANGEPV